MAEDMDTPNQVADAPSEAEVAAVKEASSQGWVAKEKFKGNEEDWVDAQTFVKRGREILPILRKNNENLMKELNQTKASLAEFRVAADEFKKFQKTAYERKAKELEQEVKELRAARAQAITDGDGAKVNLLDDAIDSAKEEAKAAKVESVQVAKPIPAAPIGVDPKLQVWLDKNEWFGKDKRLTAMTNSLGESLRLENPSLIGDAFLQKLDEALAEEFPQKFGRETERKPNYTAESGSGRGRVNGSGKHSFENLPAEAKDACNRFVKQKLMTKEQYLESYNWE